MLKSLRGLEIGFEPRPDCKIRAFSIVLHNCSERSGWPLKTVSLAQWPPGSLQTFDVEAGLHQSMLGLGEISSSVKENQDCSHQALTCILFCIKMSLYEMMVVMNGRVLLVLT